MNEVNRSTKGRACRVSGREGAREDIHSSGQVGPEAGLQDHCFVDKVFYYIGRACFCGLAHKRGDIK